jgi:hypothetical protein
MDVLAGDRDALRALYEQPGPFATVYLDATRSTEAGAHEIELRSAAVRDSLAQAGADIATLDAIGAAVSADTGVPGRHGLLVVACGGEVRFSRVLPEPPATSTGTLAPLPRLMPYLAQRAHDVRHVVVVADRTGADLLVVPAPARGGTASVAGSVRHPLHRTGRDVWSERHFQHRVENAWETNARDVAMAVAKQVERSAAELVVVAGDVRARSMIAHDLGAVLPQHVAVRVVEAGGKAAGASADSLQDAVHGEVLRQVWAQRGDVLAHVQQNLGRAEFAVAGVARVVDALRMAQIDTLLISDDPTSTLRCWVGPTATQFGMQDGEADARGVSDPAHDRLDSALVRAVVGTGATLVVTPGAHDFVTDGIAALLRFDASAQEYVRSA